MKWEIRCLFMMTCFRMLKEKHQTFNLINTSTRWRKRPLKMNLATFKQLYKKNFQPWMISIRKLQSMLVILWCRRKCETLISSLLSTVPRWNKLYKIRLIDFIKNINSSKKTQLTCSYIRKVMSQKFSENKCCTSCPKMIHCRVKWWIITRNATSLFSSTKTWKK